MRKLFTFFLILSLTLGLTACSGGPEISEDEALVSNEECQCSIVIPKTWNQDLDRYPRSFLELGSDDGRQTVIVYMVPNDLNVDLYGHGAEIMSMMENDSKKFELHSKRNVKINGMKAVQYRFDRFDGTYDTTNILTFVEARGQIYQILALTIPAMYSQFRDGLQEIIQSFEVYEDDVPQSSEPAADELKIEEPAAQQFIEVIPSEDGELELKETSPEGV